VKGCDAVCLGPMLAFMHLKAVLLTLDAWVRGTVICPLQAIKKVPGRKEGTKGADSFKVSSFQLK